jgi:glycosyltransferase involved in cell wall biosynthesis
MNICYICSEYPPSPHGGIGSVTKYLAEGLAARGHTVHVAGIYGRGQSGVEIINGVHVHRLVRTGQGIIGELRKRLHFTRYLQHLAQTHRFDLIEAPEWRGDSSLLKVPCPVVLRMHKSHTVDRLVTNGGRPSRLVRLFESLALRRADAFCAVSRFIADKTGEIFPVVRSRTCTVIWNGVDPELFSPDDAPPAEEDLVGFVGSCKYVKGVRALLQAFVLANQQYKCRLEIYGGDSLDQDGGSYLENSLGMVPMDIRERITYKGRVSRDSLPAIYRRFTIAVFPSLIEALPMVPLEAMACGTPIVLGNCGPHEEIIEDGVDGLICDAHDPTDISRQILKMLKDKELRFKIGHAARRKVEQKFSLDAALHKNLDFYQQVVRNRFL